MRRVVGRGSRKTEITKQSDVACRRSLVFRGRYARRAWPWSCHAEGSGSARELASQTNELWNLNPSALAFRSFGSLALPRPALRDYLRKFFSFLFCGYSSGSSVAN